MSTFALRHNALLQFQENLALHAKQIKLNKRCSWKEKYKVSQGILDRLRRIENDVSLSSFFIPPSIYYLCNPRNCNYRVRHPLVLTSRLPRDISKPDKLHLGVKLKVSLFYGAIMIHVLSFSCDVVKEMGLFGCYSNNCNLHSAV